MGTVPEADKAFIAWAIRHNAARHLALYRRHSNGLLVWRAFQEYRGAGLPVPEEILGIFDKWAAAVQAADGEVEVAKAIQAETIGPYTARKRLRRLQRKRDLLERYVTYRFHQKMRPGKALERLAEETRLPLSQLKTMISRWRSPPSPATTSTSAGTDLQAAWLQHFDE